MSEDYVYLPLWTLVENLPDYCFSLDTSRLNLSQEEIEELRKSKKELADYSRQKFKEMIESKNKRNSK